MPETDDHNFEVEHGEDYVLTPDQFRKLIEKKFERNNIMFQHNKQRESLFYADE